jgi:tetratricopeptide (TPR) repeat protein
MVELRALLVMAKACAFRGQTDDAMRLINGALSLAESIRSRRYEGAAYLVRGTIQEKSGNYVEALQSYGLAILFFRKINNLYEVANTEERIGKLYERMRESDKAEEHKRKAKEITELFRTQK